MAKLNMYIHDDGKNIIEGIQEFTTATANASLIFYAVVLIGTKFVISGYYNNSTYNENEVLIYYDNIEDLIIYIDDNTDMDVINICINVYNANSISNDTYSILVEDYETFFFVENDVKNKFVYYPQILSLVKSFLNREIAIHAVVVLISIALIAGMIFLIGFDDIIFFILFMILFPVLINGLLHTSEHIDLLIDNVKDRIELSGKDFK